MYLASRSPSCGDSAQTVVSQWPLDPPRGLPHPRFCTNLHCGWSRQQLRHRTAVMDHEQKINKGSQWSYLTTADREGRLNPQRLEFGICLSNSVMIIRTYAGRSYSQYTPSRLCLISCVSQNNDVIEIKALCSITRSGIRIP